MKGFSPGLLLPGPGGCWQKYGLRVSPGVAEQPLEPKFPGFPASWRDFVHPRGSVATRFARDRCPGQWKPWLPCLTVLEPSHLPSSRRTSPIVIHSFRPRSPFAPARAAPAT